MIYFVSPSLGIQASCDQQLIPTNRTQDIIYLPHKIPVSVPFSSKYKILKNPYSDLICAYTNINELYMYENLKYLIFN